MQQDTDWIEGILNNLQFKALNPMQLAAMEACAMHDNVVLLSATGSGKTLAFMLPLVQLLQSAPTQTKAIIVVPSRELALQIESVFKSMGLYLKVSCCYGGHKREIEENNLKQAPALIIGTPGRIGDHIRRGNIQTHTIETLVLDEFDKSLEMGFQEELAFIIGALPGLKQRILTSATAPDEIPEFVGLQAPFTLNFLNGEEPGDIGLAVKALFTQEKDKADSLFRLLCMLGNRSTIVFCNHRDAVQRTSELLKEKDILNVFYHGALEQRDRETALCKFRNGTANVLVTTDLASRGLDVANIRYIVHYHLPATQDVYTHRNGRTARMDASGTAILMVGPGEKLPPFISPGIENIALPEETIIPEKPKWSTIWIGAGKKDKVNKIDIVGFLTNKGQLKKEDIGLIEVKDFFSYAALRKSKVNDTLHLIKDEKLKGKKVKIAVAK